MSVFNRMAEPILFVQQLHAHSHSVAHSERWMALREYPDVARPVQTQAKNLPGRYR